MQICHAYHSPTEMMTIIYFRVTQQSRLYSPVGLIWALPGNIPAIIKWKPPKGFLVIDSLESRALQYFGASNS